MRFLQVSLLYLFGFSLFSNKFDYGKIDVFFSNKIKKGQLAGASVVVIENGSTTYMKSFGRRKKNAKDLIDENTVFQLGSLSKSFTASAFKVGLDQKKVTLNQPSIISGVNAAHILSHTTGFSRYGFNNLIESGKKRDELLSTLLNKKQKAPGKFFDYHNVAYSLIEDILQNAYGQPFSLILENNVFKPLKLTSASSNIEKYKNEKNKAWPHEKSRKGIYPSASFSYRYHETVPSSAGVNANIKDLAEFLKWQLNDKSFSVIHAPVIRTKNYDSMLKKKIKLPFETYYSYGFRIIKVKDEEIIYHAGFLKGFNNIIAFSTKNNKAIAVLQNTAPSSIMSLILEFFIGTPKK